MVASLRSQQYIITLRTRFLPSVFSRAVSSSDILISLSLTNTKTIPGKNTVREVSSRAHFPLVRRSLCARYRSLLEDTSPPYRGRQTKSVSARKSSQGSRSFPRGIARNPKQQGRRNSSRIAEQDRRASRITLGQAFQRRNCNAVLKFLVHAGMKLSTHPQGCLTPLEIRAAFFRLSLIYKLINGIGRCLSVGFTSVSLPEPLTRYGRSSRVTISYGTNVADTGCHRCLLRLVSPRVQLSRLSRW